jgi:CMP-N-acetylneuraminic acid synthetase
MKNYSIVAIVPMRHSSERVKGKNYRDFAGSPLFFHIIKSLLKCTFITKVVIDTDSPEVIRLAEEYFKEKIVILERPQHLRDGGISMNEVLLNLIKQIPADFYLQTHSTNPLLQPSTIERGVRKFLELYPMYDSLFSVTRRHVRLWDSLARPINHNQNILLRTQDLPPVFEENSCLYLFTKEILERKHNRIGDRPFLFEIPEIEAHDIDVELNFKMAEFLYKELNGQNTIN